MDKKLRAIRSGHSIDAAPAGACAIEEQLVNTRRQAKETTGNLFTMDTAPERNDLRRLNRSAQRSSGRKRLHIPPCTHKKTMIVRPVSQPCSGNGRANNRSFFISKKNLRSTHLASTIRCVRRRPPNSNCAIYTPEARCDPLNIAVIYCPALACPSNSVTTSCPRILYTLKTA